MAKIPNFITISRIIASLFMLITEPFSVAFYTIYTLCGISDALDGIIARRFRVATEVGAVLDSVADLTFYSSLLIRLIPYLYTRVSVFVWYAVGFVVLLRLVTYTLCAVKFHQLSALHTYLNKLTGFAIFSFPFFMLIAKKTPLAFVVCGISFISTIEELFIHITSSSYPQGKRTILKKRL